MIRVITDNSWKPIEVNTAAELAPYLGDIFKADAVSDVVVTYVISQQPTSRRAIATAE